MEEKEEKSMSVLHWADSEIDSVIWKRIKPVYVRPSFVPEEEE
jgi:hypothetical protein